MRWSRTLIPTLREDPADADTPSYRLMVRAGLIRKMGPGIYSYLPLGERVLQKATQIVREEFARTGAVEISLPVLQPSELSESTQDSLKVRDAHGRTGVLSSAEEEIVTRIAANEISSHRQLPITVFQIQLKFRSEARPRSGVVGGREWLSADAYSFHPSVEDLDREYQVQKDAFQRVFKRAKLDVVEAEAETEAHEFLSPNSYGDDELVRCPKCRYTANIEKAECVETHGRLSSPSLSPELFPLEEIETPDLSTVDQVARFLKVPPHLIVKTMIVRTESGFVAALVRGDHSVNLSKLSKVLRVRWIELATPAEVERVTGSAFGFSGPVGMSLNIVADLAIEHLQNFVTGANKQNFHYVNTNQYRDFKPQLFGDIRMAQVGDLCSRCLAPLEFVKSIRIGQMMKVKTPDKAAFKNEKGQAKPIVIGHYGLSVSRLVAAAIELHHDKGGIIWPKELAPHPVIMCTVNPKDDRIAKASEQIYEKLMAAGIDALWDDRDVAPGVKFKDSDLIGVPVRITIGNKTVKDGTVDLKIRNIADQTSVSSKGVVESVKHALKDYRL